MDINAPGMPTKLELRNQLDAILRKGWGACVGGPQFDNIPTVADVEAAVAALRELSSGVECAYIELERDDDGNAIDYAGTYCYGDGPERAAMCRMCKGRKALDGLLGESLGQPLGDDPGSMAGREAYREAARRQEERDRRDGGPR